MFNDNAERTVLGSLLIEGDLIKECSLTPANFYRPAHQMIYEAMQSVEQQDIPLDIVTLSAALGDRIMEIGGIGYLTRLTDGVPSIIQFETYQDRKSVV